MRSDIKYVFFARIERPIQIKIPFFDVKVSLRCFYAPTPAKASAGDIMFSGCPSSQLFLWTQYLKNTLRDFYQIWQNT